jgi:O-antigen/teichoic acid export membrane protein
VSRFEIVIPGAGSEGPRASDPTSASSRHIRSSGLMLLGRLIGVVMNFVAQVVIVRHLAKADYGAFAYGFAFMMFGSHVVGLGLERSVNRFVPIYHERREYDKMAGAILFVIGVICTCGLALVAMVYGLQGLIAERAAPDPLALSLLLILICMAPVQALDDLTVRLFAIFASPRAVFLRRYVLTPTLKLAAVLAVVTFHGDAVFLAVAQLVAGVLAVAISAAVIAGVLHDQDLLRYFRWGAFRIPARRVLRFGLPLLSSDVVTALRGNMVVILLGALASSTGVASFRAVFPVARLNAVVFDAFKMLFVPQASRMYARGDRAGISHLYWRSCSWIVVFSFPVFAVSFPFADPLTVLLFGERYADSGDILALLSLGIFVNAATGFNSRILQVFHAVRTIVRIDLAVVVVALVLNVVLIRAHGALGGAAASCAVTILQNALYQVALIRRGAVEGIDVSFLKVLATASTGAAALYAFQALLAPPLAAAALAAAAVSLLVVWVTGPLLAVESVFPELRRFALARRLLGMRAEAPAAERPTEPVAPGSQPLS